MTSMLTKAGRDDGPGGDPGLRKTSGVSPRPGGEAGGKQR